MLVLLSAASTFASIDEVRLHVEGLACPFCTFGIEKGLKKVPGVISAETTIRTGVVRVQMEPSTPLDYAALWEAVKESGFTLASIEATVTGTLVSREDKPALKSIGNGQIFLLVESDGEFLSNETLDNLKEASLEGSGLLTVWGQVHSHVDMPQGLTVEHFEVVK